MRVSQGIMHALPPDRVAHYARFIHDYEQIRAAEGRGSEDDSFYLGLPYTDSTGRNGGQWRIRARSFDYLLTEALNQNFQGAGGSVLDLGAGNCWMSYRLALAGFRSFAVDLLTNPNDGLGAAEHYRKHLPVLFPRIQAELSALPFQDGQFDAAIFNASFHYAENEEAALNEALRCLRSGGILVICDTPWYSREESGRRMVSERSTAFLQRYGTASDSIDSMEYLTDERLRSLETRLGIQWTVHSPNYGFRWTMRPLVARLHNRREPSRFRIYVTRKSS
jgi:SAM-dependent methyltransferase